MHESASISGANERRPIVSQRQSIHTCLRLISDPRGCRTPFASSNHPGCVLTGWEERPATKHARLDAVAAGAIHDRRLWHHQRLTPPQPGSATRRGPARDVRASAWRNGSPHEAGRGATPRVRPAPDMCRTAAAWHDLALVIGLQRAPDLIGLTDQLHRAPDRQAGGIVHGDAAALRCCSTWAGPASRLQPRFMVAVHGAGFGFGFESRFRVHGSVRAPRLQALASVYRQSDEESDLRGSRCRSGGAWFRCGWAPPAAAALATDSGRMPTPRPAAVMPLTVDA